jgi:ABC-type Fe3+ transport system substrate-binding protein
MPAYGAVRRDFGWSCFIGMALLATFLFIQTARAQDASLVAAAQKEGEVDWYTTLIINQAVLPIKEAFEKKYPGIKVEYVRDDDAPLGIKIYNEEKADQVHGDIFDGLDNMVALQRAGYVVPFKPANVADYPDELKEKDGYWTAYVLYVFAPGINTTMVSMEGAPKTYQDLLDPKWKGKVAWNPNSVAGAIGFVGASLLSMGEENGMSYLHALAKQNIVNIPASSRAILDQVIAGEYPMALMTFNNHSVISASKGAPSAWVKMQPMPVALNAVSLLKNAPHPNAGKLLIDFITSPEGQKVFQQAGYLPALPGVPASVAGLKPQDGGFKAVYLLPELIDAHSNDWQKVVTDLFR